MNVKKKITQRLVDTAKPGSKTYWIRDTLIPGFCIKVTTAGSKVFNLDYLHRPTGSNRRWKIGDARWMKTEVARTLAYDLKGQIMAGLYPTRSQEVKTVGEICSAYVERFSTEWKTGQAERYLRKFVLPTFARMAVTEVTFQTVNHWLDTMKANHEFSSNMHHALVYFKRAWRWAYSVGVTTTPLPFGEAKAPHRSKSVKFLPSGEEWAGLGSNLIAMLDSGRFNPFSLYAVQMLAYTGCRIKEVRGMKMSHIDHEQGAILIPEHKTDHIDPDPKIVEMTPQIRALITRCLEQKMKMGITRNPYLFPGVHVARRTASIDRPISEKGLQYTWQQLRYRAGSNMQLRNFRSAKVSIGKQLGLTAEQIADVTKHKSLQVLFEHYMTSDRAEVQNRANKLTRDIHERLFGSGND